MTADASNNVSTSVLTQLMAIQDGVCSQQDGTVVEGLHKRALLSSGVAREGKHHNTPVTKDIPAMPKLRVVNGLARFDCLAS